VTSNIDLLWKRVKNLLFSSINKASAQDLPKRDHIKKMIIPWGNLPIIDAYK